MASTVKLTSPTKGRVVVVPESQVAHYTAHGWVVEQKETTKEAPVAKRNFGRRKSAPAKTAD